MFSIKKQDVCHFDYPYALCVYSCNRGKKVLCATEVEGPGYCFDAGGVSQAVESVWSAPGGTMTICQLDDREEFLVTHRFFKGFRAAEAYVSHVLRLSDGSWKIDKLFELPYLHRFSVVNVHREKWIVGATLCESKKSRDDWSSPGSIYIAKLELEKPMQLQLLYHGITKNHGMYVGPYGSKQEVVICTGSEGAFVVIPPDFPSGDWRVEKILSSEISDIRVFDVDGDGEEELVTIEGFHGNLMKIYKRVNGQHHEVYSFPLVFGHPIWCGEFLGQRHIIIGYKQANSGLYVLTPRKKDGKLSMDVQMIDELEEFSNIDCWDEGNVFHIYAACSTGKVVHYTLTPGSH